MIWKHDFYMITGKTISNFSSSRAIKSSVFKIFKVRLHFWDQFKCQIIMDDAITKIENQKQIFDSKALEEGFRNISMISDV